MELGSDPRGNGSAARGGAQAVNEVQQAAARPGYAIPSAHVPAARNGTPAGQPPARRRRSLALDVLRIFAALWVVLFHWHGVYWWAWMPDWITHFADAGYLGVDVFFILSGAVISFTAIGRSWIEFGRARFLRLYPAYVFVTLATVLLALHVGGWEPPATEWLSFTGIQFWSGAETIVSVAWTLFYEIGFYALVTLLIFLRKRLTVETLRGGVFVLLVLNLIALYTEQEVLLFLTLGSFAGHFAFGVLLGISRTTDALRRNLLGLMVAGGLVFQELAGRTAELNLSVLRQILFILVIIFGCACFIMWATLRRTSESKFPRMHRATTTLALMTYPLYLIHQAFGLGITSELIELGWPKRLALPVSMIIMFAICWACVRFFEPHARDWLSRAFLWMRTIPSRPVLTTGEHADPAPDECAREMALTVSSPGDS
jgi:peptidoglycan/LPS O-acetylase OafA/YrhL